MHGETETNPADPFDPNLSCSLDFFFNHWVNFLLENKDLGF